MTAILDTSFLFALTDKSDRNHQQVMATIQTVSEDLILPIVVLPEISYLISSRLGHFAMRRFIDGLKISKICIEPIDLKDIENNILIVNLTLRMLRSFPSLKDSISPVFTLSIDEIS